MSRYGRKARAVLALDAVASDRRNRDRGASLVLDVLREMLQDDGAAGGGGLKLFAPAPSDPVQELLDEHDELVAAYGAPAMHGALELLARIAAAAVGELAEQRGKDPQKVLVKIARQFGEVD